MNRLSLQSKLVLSFSVLLLILLLGQLVFNLFFATDYYSYKTSQVMMEAAEEIELHYSGTAESIEEVAKFYEDHYNLDIKIYAEDDATIYATSNRFRQHFGGEAPPTPPGPRTQEEQLDSVSTPMIVQTDERDQGNILALHLLETFSYNAEPVYITMNLTMSSIENSVSLLTGVSTVITGVILLLGLILFIFLSKAITKPIGEIQKTALRITQLDFSAKVKETQFSPELSSLAQSVNLMSFQLEHVIQELNEANEQLKKDIASQKELEQMRREFVANVSHEMKTPLALLQIYADNLKNNIDSIDKDEYCQVILQESEHLSDMVSTMLDTSALENRLVQLEKRPLCFSALCQEYLDKVKPLTDEHVFSQNIQSDIWVYGSASHLQQAIKNYLNNALEHTKKGQRIQVQLVQEKSCAVFSVYNEGSGVEKEDIQQIWSSFYRSDKARVHSDGNVGMGLYIVKTIIEEHAGQCSVQNCESGVIFSFTLPISNESF